MIELSISPEVIRDGKNVFLINLPDFNIKFIRINNYLSGDEHQIAEQFNIKVSKHYFPEKFNSINNYSYTGQIPDKSFFINFKDSKTVIEQKLIFINNCLQTNYKWDFRKELFRFVDENLFLLTKSCLIFLKDCFTFQSLLQETEKKKFVHPFGNEICTIAGFTFKVYKLFYLNKYPIFSVINEFGNNGKEMSRQEAEWVAFMHFKYPENKYFSGLLHPKGQKYFNETIPDLYSPITKEAMFYCGCYWHGHHTNCLINPNAKSSTLNSTVKKSYLQLNDELHKKMKSLLENHPNEVISATIQWECDYLQKREKVPEIKDFLLNHYKPGPLYRLKPRTAIRGAYFENFALKWVKNENNDETFYALDLNGMYSYCAIKNKFMTGPYKILVGSLLDDIKFINDRFYYKNNEMFGTMLLTIVPPKNLFEPFLLYRLENGTTVNTLCSKCAEKKIIVKCYHSDEERSITSTYFISEINYAINLGYKVTQIHECHYFESTDFILKDFVQKLNCLKIQNSNFLKNCKTRAEKDSYCKFLNEIMELNDPFCLKVDNVCDNESAKQFFKLLSNSLFGKLEQKHNKSKTKFVTSQEQLENIYFSNEKIKQISCINENLCQVEIIPHEKNQSPNRTTNCYIGGQLTAFARQLIHEHLKSVSDLGKLYYCDCDCIYFTMKTNSSSPLNISDAVGHFKEVFPGEIVSFYSLGPKSYAISYKEKDGTLKTVTKVKGISLSNQFSENQINSDLFDFYMSQYLQEQIEKKEIVQLKLKKNKKVLKVEPHLEMTTFSNQITKRRMVAKQCQYLTTFPYGYEYFP